MKRQALARLCTFIFRFVNPFALIADAIRVSLATMRWVILYVDTVLKEWDLYRAKLGRDITISELHLGGGTPTFLSPSELDRLASGILEKAKQAKHFEFSVEADPRVTNREHLATLAKLGFKRLSLGIQDFDPKVQDIVHRVQTEEEVLKIVEMGRELGFNSINYDLIYGLPFQTRQSIERTIDVVRKTSTGSHRFLRLCARALDQTKPTPIYGSGFARRG
ncbi:unnamed protein product [Sphagnum jensenii]|uniref:Elp3/MiaA/NifB-like radical SAM core domain-containing protein n=1 Tax=Sphagnum jensenii TaxID=128206 RepID=A0ABP0V5X5_9BRYO